MSQRASAPGKVMWAGEYAVLAGAPAVLTAVARRAVATIGGTPGHSPVLAAIRRLVAEEYPDARAQAATLAVDSSALADAGIKLGVGSSAATAAAAAGLALAHLAGDAAAWRAATHALAHEAHARAQAPRGARGSGADVAACVHGGVLAVTPAAPSLTDDRTPPPLVRALAWPPELAACLVATGVAADTPRLVARVRDFRTAQPALADIRIAALGDAATALVAAFDARSSGRVIAAVTAAGIALAALARDAAVDLQPQSLVPTLDLALAHGGIAKTTGAGGGDQLLVVLPSIGAARAFLGEAAKRGLAAWPLDVEVAGVRLEQTPEST